MKIAKFPDDAPERRENQSLNISLFCFCCHFALVCVGTGNVNELKLRKLAVKPFQVVKKLHCSIMLVNSVNINGTQARVADICYWGKVDTRVQCLCPDSYFTKAVDSNISVKQVSPLNCSHYCGKNVGCRKIVFVYRHKDKKNAFPEFFFFGQRHKQI